MLDLFIVSKNLVPYIEKLEIDKDLNWTPSRSVKGNLKFPDHYALLLTMKNLPINKPSSQVIRKQIIWNTRKKNGWLMYSKKTENNVVFNKLIESKEEDPEKVLKIIEKEMKSIKFSCFGKIKVTSKDKNIGKLEELQKEKNEVIAAGKDDKIKEWKLLMKKWQEY